MDGLMVPDRENQLLLAQKKILEGVALGNDFQRSLDELCLASELMVPGSVCSVIQWDRIAGHMEFVSSPNLPSAAVAIFDQMIPGKGKGSCSGALLEAVPVYVSDTSNDPHWVDLLEFARQFNIRACWSYPVKNRAGEVIGSFAIFSFEIGEPTQFQQQLLSESANIAGIIMERRQREQALWEKAHRDELTGLFNRAMFNTALEHSISSAARRGAKLAVLFVDLDNFKEINDTFGHRAGDDVLVTVASRLRVLVRCSDISARFGGDEFALLLENIEGLDTVARVAGLVVEECARPVRADGVVVSTSASVGIAVFPDDGAEPESLLRHADRSMYRAKAGECGYYFYRQELSRAVEDRDRLAADFPTAFADGQLVLQYQALFPRGSTQPSAVEALVRWNHPERGFLEPEVFLGLMHERGLSDDLFDWVLRESCLQARQWARQGLDLDVVVNCAVSKRGVDLASRVAEALDELDWPAARLELDVEADLLERYGDVMVAELKALAASGVKVALDNFGVGRQSLVELMNLTVHRIKLSRRLVSHLDESGRELLAVKAAVALASCFDIPVLAKGVENHYQREQVLREGCAMLQGHLLAKPMTATDFTKHFLSAGIAANVS